MQTADGASLREEFKAVKARVAELRSQGKAPGDIDAVFGILFTPPEIPVAVQPGKTARNSGVPPSQTEVDGTARRPAADGGGRQPRRRTAIGRQPQMRRPRSATAGPTCPASNRPAGSPCPGRYGVRGRREMRRGRDEGTTRLRQPDLGTAPRRHAGAVAARRRPAGRRGRPACRADAFPAPGRRPRPCPALVRRPPAVAGRRRQTSVGAPPALHADLTGMRVDGRSRRLHVVTDGRRH